MVLFARAAGREFSFRIDDQPTHRKWVATPYHVHDCILFLLGEEKH